MNKVTSIVDPIYLIVTADLFVSLGNRFIILSLIDTLVFKGTSPVSSLVLISIIEHGPSIVLSSFAGVWVDQMGAKKWLMLVNLIKCLLVTAFFYATSCWTIFPLYFCFIVTSLFFNIGRLSLIPVLIPKNQLIAFNSLNARITLFGAILAPWLIGCIIAKAGQAAAFGCAFFMFLASISIIALILEPGQIKKETDGSPLKLKPKKQRKFNLFSVQKRILKNSDNLKFYFFILGFALIGGGILNFGLPIFYKNNFGGDIAGGGFILSEFKAG